jgi:transposase
MSSVQLYVGLDYHQDSVQVCVLDEHAKVRLNRPVANDWRKIREAVAPLGGDVRRVAVEACCGSADLAQELADHAGCCLPIQTVSPAVCMSTGETGNGG